MLKVGDIAPDFILQGDDGSNYQLKDFRGKNVVLYFYPKDLTPGCTVEACDFNDNLKSLSHLNTVVLGVSKDPLTTHARFKSKYGLGFMLLSDPEMAVHKTYGAYGEKKMYGKTSLGVLRTTYLIDSHGKIVKVWSKVRANGHVAMVVDFVKRLVEKQEDLLSAHVKAK